MSAAAYDLVVGLEVHVQLQTRTKLFCRCRTTFGADPNTQTCPVCCGLPGALPVMNRKALEFALRTAVALNCEIPAYTKWDRKQYYYPDLPKGYQISQYDLPLSQHGWLEISDSKGRFEPKRVRILRAHLEEDAGKSMHDEAAGKADSRIDLNRAGTPLLEIVSQPDLRSALEAKTYLNELKLLLTYLGVSDCNMQEGSLRVDANVNLHLPTASGTVATPIVEIKNMNSFRAVERALEYETRRQFDLFQETGIRLGQAGGQKTTRGWDDQTFVTWPQRQKEESSDYRYFPDPDLPPVQVSAEQLTEIRQQLGELPAVLRTRLEHDYQIEAYDADVIVNQGRDLVDYYERLADRCRDGKRASNWVQQDVLRVLNETGEEIGTFGVSAESLGELLASIGRGEIDNSRAKEVFQRMLETGDSAAAAMQALGIAQVDDQELRALCQQLLEENPHVVADLKAGKLKAVGALIGQAKKRNPNINPNQLREMCLELATDAAR
jgi:aspartyl-tRNA(Asn)/glutamyl-tRNA(Gln) amidotransferase subunit B